MAANISKDDVIDFISNMTVLELSELVKEGKLQDLSDQSLVVRCINGDKSAWDKFIERFSQLILWAIKKKLNRANCHYNQQDVEDIFQDVFILLWEKGKLRQIKHRKAISSWLAMVTANCALNHFRNRATRPVGEKLAQEQMESCDYTAFGTTEQVRLHDILAETFNFLSVREQLILKLNYLYDKTHQEIGVILKMPANTVSSIIKRTKESLKRKLDKEGFKIF